MKLKEAIKILETHNLWRRGLLDDMVCTPEELGIAIDVILKEVNTRPDKGCKVLSAK